VYLCMLSKKGNQKVVEDIEKRLENLYGKLDNGQLSDKALRVLSHLTAALAQADYDKAAKVQVDLITQYYDEVGFAMIGVKRILAALTPPSS